MKFPRLETSAGADLLKVFDERGVEYGLIGSMPKAVHCPKLACDNELNLMIDSTPDRARKVLTVLQAVPDTRDSEKLAINIQRS